MMDLSFAARLRSLLPRGWFPDETPVLDAVLDGADAQWSALWDQLVYLQAQTRLTTATGAWLDGKAADFLGYFPRRIAEPDAAYSLRARREILRPRATRNALIQAIGDELGLPSDDPAVYVDPASGAWEVSPDTGTVYVSTPALRSSVIRAFEPANATDTGGASGLAGGGGGLMVGGVGQPGAGGTGSLDMPFEIFVDLPRPTGSGLANVAGASTGAGGVSDLSALVGGLRASSLSEVTGGVTDADLYACVARVLPAGVKAWTRITGGAPLPTPAIWGQSTWGSSTWAGT